MDSAHKRLTDPDFVRTTLSGLDQFFSEGTGDDGVTSEAGHSLISTDGSISLSIDAADFLDHFFPDTVVQRVADLSDEESTEPGEPELEINRADDPARAASTPEPVTLAEAPLEPVAVNVPLVALPAEPIELDAIEPVKASDLMVDAYEPAPAEPAPPAQAKPAAPVAAQPIVVAPAMDLLLGRLGDAESLLQSANFRIGYLQSEIDRYRDQVKLLPDLEAQARRAAELERANTDIKQRLPELEQRARRFVALQRENERLRSQLHEAYAEKSSPWWHIWKDLMPSPKAQEHRPSANDYMHSPRAGRR